MLEIAVCMYSLFACALKIKNCVESACQFHVTPGNLMIDTKASRATRGTVGVTGSTSLRGHRHYIKLILR